MTEVTDGMVRALKKLNATGSLVRTAIYTVGHIIIAVTCVMLITGSTLEQALTDAFVEPLLNSVWFFILDRFWASRVANKQPKQQHQIRVVPQIDPENIQPQSDPDLTISTTLDK